MKIRHPQNLKQIIPINFFSVFDGHGGEAIAEELNENLHKQIVYSKNFFENPIEAILLAFQKIEEKILKKNYKLFTNNPEKSGSCAIISIFIGNQLFLIFSFLNLIITDGIKNKIIKSMEITKKYFK